MDWVKTRKSCLDMVKKYRYAILVVAIGLVLMALPERGQPASQQDVTEPTVQETQDPGKTLEALLGDIQGAGKVKVMLTISKGAETVYQSDVDVDTGEQTSASRQDTVVITDENRGQQGLVRQVNPPVYRGAVVLCQGADNPAVRLAVVEAVSCVTGLRSDSISVLKMK